MHRTRWRLRGRQTWMASLTHVRTLSVVGVNRSLPDCQALRSTRSVTIDSTGIQRHRTITVPREKSGKFKGQQAGAYGRF